MTADSQPVVLRIGIATGEVVAALREVAGNRSIALTGDPMTTAARLQQLAEPNEILMDDAMNVAAEPRIGVEIRARRSQRSAQALVLGVDIAPEESASACHPGSAARLDAHGRLDEAEQARSSQRGPGPRVAA